jgi:hypothetical protein
VTGPPSEVIRFCIPRRRAPRWLRCLLARLTLPIALASAAGVVTSPAHASQLIDRSASSVSLEVNTAGEALLTYTARGEVRHVLAWGAVDAAAPSERRVQVSFALDYAGGWRKHHRAVWRSFKNACRPYTSAPLSWLVVACTAPDGSHWAIQSWSRGLPDYGTGTAAAPDLRLSHWTDPIARLTVGIDWAYRRFDHLFGRFTYRNAGVYGNRSTADGVALDDFGRNLYIDTFNSQYGPGWRRENAILTHRPTGAFCYGFFPHGDRPAGKGTRYRATIIGPGVTPDVTWEGTAPARYIRRADRKANAAIRALHDPLCVAN